MDNEKFCEVLLRLNKKKRAEIHGILPFSNKDHKNTRNNFKRTKIKIKFNHSYVKRKIFVFNIIFNGNIKKECKSHSKEIHVMHARFTHQFIFSFTDRHPCWVYSSFVRKMNKKIIITVKVHFDSLLLSECTYNKTKNFYFPLAWHDMACEWLQFLTTIIKTEYVSVYNLKLSSWQIIKILWCVNLIFAHI